MVDRLYDGNNCNMRDYSHIICDCNMDSCPSGNFESGKGESECLGKKVF